MRNYSPKGTILEPLELELDRMWADTQPAEFVPVGENDEGEAFGFVETAPGELSTVLPRSMEDQSSTFSTRSDALWAAIRAFNSWRNS